MIRPQEALFAGNSEFADLGIPNYLNILRITHIVSSSTHYETIRRIEGIF